MVSAEAHSHSAARRSETRPSLRIRAHSSFLIDGLKHDARSGELYPNLFGFRDCFGPIVPVPALYSCLLGKSAQLRVGHELPPWRRVLLYLRPTIQTRKPTSDSVLFFRDTDFLALDS